MLARTDDSLEARIFALGEVIDALCIVFNASSEQRKSLKYRIKTYQIAGLAPASRGAGRAIVYMLSDVYDYAFALSLARYGLDPKNVVAVLKRGSFLDRFGEKLINCDVEKASAKNAFQRENLTLIYFNSLFLEASDTGDPVKLQAEPAYRVPEVTGPLILEMMQAQGLPLAIDLHQRTMTAIAELGLSLIDLTSLRDRVKHALDQV